MPDITWDPAAERPLAAPELEAAIRRLAPGARVKLTRVHETWRVRALAPAAFCARGGDAASRDVSASVAELLTDAGVPAATFER